MESTLEDLTEVPDDITSDANLVDLADNKPAALGEKDFTELNQCKNNRKLVRFLPLKIEPFQVLANWNFCS